MFNEYIEKAEDFKERLRKKRTKILKRYKNLLKPDLGNKFLSDFYFIMCLVLNPEQSIEQVIRYQTTLEVLAERGIH